MLIPVIINFKWQQHMKGEPVGLPLEFAKNFCHKMIPGTQEYLATINDDPIALQACYEHYEKSRKHGDPSYSETLKSFFQFDWEPEIKAPTQIDDLEARNQELETKILRYENQFEASNTAANLRESELEKENAEYKELIDKIENEPGKKKEFLGTWKNRKK